MKKLFFAAALTLGSFMFINAQDAPTEVQEEVLIEVQEEVATEVQEEIVTEVQEEITTEVQEEGNVAE